MMNYNFLHRFLVVGLLLVGGAALGMEFDLPVRDPFVAKNWDEAQGFVDYLKKKYPDVPAENENFNRVQKLQSARDKKPDFTLESFNSVASVYEQGIKAEQARLNFVKQSAARKKEIEKSYQKALKASRKQTSELYKAMGASPAEVDAAQRGDFETANRLGRERLGAEFKQRKKRDEEFFTGLKIWIIGLAIAGTITWYAASELYSYLKGKYYRNSFFNAIKQLDEKAIRERAKHVEFNAGDGEGRSILQALIHALAQHKNVSVSKAKRLVRMFAHQDTVNLVGPQSNKTALMYAAELLEPQVAKAVISILLENGAYTGVKHHGRFARDYATDASVRALLMPV